MSNPPSADDRLARRNALLLAFAQSLGGATASIVISTGSLVGSMLLSENKGLATVPVTAMVLGTALGTLPAGAISRRLGRRTGFMGASLLSVFGGLLAAAAIIQGAFWLFALACGLNGFAGAFVQQYRFAAADTASEAFRPRAISWVMAGGVLAGVIGPQTVIWSKDILVPWIFAGTFIAQAGLGVLALGLVSLLHIPNPAALQVGSQGRSLTRIMLQPATLVAVACGVTSYALMSLVMTAAPLAMIGCGFSETEATLGIQWHVLAMFGPSFFTGSLIARFGKKRVTAIGLALLAACAVVALSGVELSHFWGALILLGLGWNFGFIGATALLTDAYRPEERNMVQATNDFLVFGFVAFASFSSGQLLDRFGWDAVNWIVFPFVVLALVLLACLFMHQTRKGEVDLT